MREKTANNPRTKRLLSLLLAVVMFVTAQGFITYADTVSQNDTKASQSADQNTTQDVETDDEQGTELEAQTQAAVPANPVHHCTDAAMVLNPEHHCTGEDDGTDCTDFSYVYFGSYPQSEVRDSATIAAIDSAIATSGTAADAGVDVWVNGTKYRRISKDDTNHDGYFDNVENNGYRYFKWERIKWRVLDNNDDGTLFVVADKALDCKNYNDEYVDITWENSTIRGWLNGSFYQSAFSSAEQSAIEPWHVVNEDNPYYDTEGGNDTTDHIYLLSIGEVTNESYGFCSDYSTYSASRRLQTSEYAHVRGAWRSTSGEYENNCVWSLRSTGYPSSNAALVNSTGSVFPSGYSVNYDYISAVPALHINLSSGIWSVVDDGTSGDGGDSTGGDGGNGTGGNNGNSTDGNGGDDISDSLKPESVVYSYDMETVDLTKEVYYIETDQQAFDLKYWAKGDGDGTFEAASLDAGADIMENQ